MIQALLSSRLRLNQVESHWQDEKANCHADAKSNPMYMIHDVKPFLVVNLSFETHGDKN